jgi:TonB family protein
MKFFLVFIISLLNSCNAMAQGLPPEVEDDMKRLEESIKKTYGETSVQRQKKTAEQIYLDRLEMNRYIKSCRSKIEKIGNQDYPIEAKQKKIFGSVQVQFDVLSTGKIRTILILNSSGSEVLDKAAVNAVELASPCQEFPDAIKKITEILTLKQNFNYIFEKNSSDDLIKAKP